MERLPLSLRREVLERYLEEVVLPADGQIAAIAHIHDLTVVTFNEADFRRFEGLHVTSW